MKYPMFKVSIDTELAMLEIESVLRSGYVNEGVEVSKFQHQLSLNLDVPNLVLMNSCTSALTVAYKLSGVGPGDEVISSPMTCIATNTPVVNLGGKLVWCDINPITGNLDPDQLEELITPRTKAIVYVDWAGNPADLEKIWEIGKRRGVKVIQDAAHAFGALWNNKSIAHFADFTCFSFQAIKHLSCGDGGALVCYDDHDYLLARKLKWFGYDRESTKDEKGEWKGQRWDADILMGEVGYKFNMNNIAAAIGLAGLTRIKEVISAHRLNASIYAEEFSGRSSLRLLEIPANAVSSFWTYTLLIETKDSENRDSVILALNKIGIGAGLVHLPNDIYSAFKESKKSLPGVREFEAKQISLPCGWWIKPDEIRWIAGETKRIVDQLVKN
jgi:perosamine synthetase